VQRKRDRKKAHLQRRNEEKKKAVYNIVSCEQQKVNSQAVTKTKDKKVKIARLKARRTRQGCNAEQGKEKQSEAKQSTRKMCCS